MTRWRREFLLRMLLAVWMCCVWGALSLLLTRGPLRVWREAHAQLAREKVNLRAEGDRLRKLQELAATHDGILQDMETIEPTPPRKLYVSSLVTQLAQLAAQNAMVLVGVTPEVPGLEEAGTLPELPRTGPLRVVATFRGHYSELTRLVDGLQQFQKAVALAAVNLRTDRSTADGTLLAELTLLAREVPGVRDMQLMITPPQVPPALLQKFNKKTVDQILNGGEAAPAEALPPGATPGAPNLVPAPKLPPPAGAPAAAAPAASAPAASAPPAAGPRSGPGTPPVLPGPTPPLGLPAPPLGLPAPPLGEPKPNEPGMMELDPGMLPKPKVPPASPVDRQGRAPAAPSPNLGPARTAANVGVMRRMWRVLRVDGLMPGTTPADTDRLAMDLRASEGKTR